MSRPPNMQPTIIEQEPPLIDEGDSPEIYVDGYSGSVAAGVVGKFPFFSMRYDHKKKQHVRKVVLTLTMPLYVVEGVHRALGEFMEQIKDAQVGLRRDG